MAKNASGIVNAKSIGVVKGLIGSATATDANGVVRVLHEGDRVYANEVVQTSAAGTVHIDFNNSSYVNIGHGSTLALDKTVFDPSAKSGQGDGNLADMRAKIAAGADPTEVTDPTAAGPTAGGDGGEQGGHNAVFVQQNAAQGSLSVSQGFETSSANNPQAAAGNEGAVLRVNHDPVAEPGTAEAVEGGYPVTGSVIATDIDGDPLTYALVDPAPPGLTFNPDGSGSYSFDPKADAYDSMAEGDTQNITVNYTVADAFGGTATSTLTITITGTNDTATITASDAEDTAALEAGGVANLVPGDPNASGTLTVTDVDHDENHFQTPSSLAGQYGTFTFDPDTGVWTYTLNNDLPTTQALTAGEAAQDVLTVTSLDGTASYDITVNITGANDTAVVTGTSTDTVTEAGGLLNTSFGDPFASGNLDVSDVDTGEAHFQMPTLGSLVGDYGFFTFVPSSGAWTYTLNNLSPATQALNAGARAQDTLTVTTHDGTPQTITVNITGSNDNAFITVGGLQDTSVREDGGINNGTPSGNSTAGGKLNVYDVDSGENQFAIPANLEGKYGTFSLTSNGNWTYTLNNADADTQALTAGQRVQDKLVVSSLDGTASYTITVNITGANDNAEITGSYTGNVVEAGGVDNGTAGDALASGNLTVTDVDAGQALFQTPASLSGTYGTFTFNASTGAWTYELNDNLPATQALNQGDQATDTLTVRSHDGTDIQVITVNIAGINDSAEITGTYVGDVVEAGGVDNGSVGVPSATGTLTVTDVDDGEAAFQTPTSLDGTYGTFTFDASTGVWSYTLNNDLPATQALNAGDPASDSLTVTSLDGTASQVITVNITGANDTAVVTGTATDTVTEAGGFLNLSRGDPSASGNLDVSDVDAGEAHFHMPALGSLVGDYGFFTFNPISGAWTYTLNNLSPATQALNADATAQDTLTVMTHDGTPQIITVNIVGSNDNAFITVSGPQDTSVTEAGGVNNAIVGDPSASGKLNVSDVDAGQNQFAIPANLEGKYGTFSFAANGTWTYTLNNNDADTEALTAGQRVQDKLTVTSIDGTASHTITVNITGAYDAPAANNPPVANPDLASTTEGQSVTILASELLLNDSDLDGDTLSLTSVQGAVNGTVSLVDGTITFTPDAGFDSAHSQTPASFTYTISDGKGGTSTATVTVNVADSGTVKDGALKVYATDHEAAPLHGTDLTFNSWTVTTINHPGSGATNTPYEDFENSSTNFWTNGITLTDDRLGWMRNDSNSSNIKIQAGKLTISDNSSTPGSLKQVASEILTVASGQTVSFAYSTANFDASDSISYQVYDTKTNTYLTAATNLPPSSSGYTTITLDSLNGSYRIVFTVNDQTSGGGGGGGDATLLLDNFTVTTPAISGWDETVTTPHEINVADLIWTSVAPISGDINLANYITGTEATTLSIAGSPADANGVITVTGSYGTLTFYTEAYDGHAAGSYVYDPIDTLTAGGEETFNIDLNQADGDSATIALTVNTVGSLLHDGETSSVYVVQHGNYDASASDHGEYIFGDDTGLQLTGSSHNDYIQGGNGGDTLTGGAGSDLLIGGGGSDILVGGAGDDVLTGGLGSDTFRYQAGDLDATAVHGDVITDFKVATIANGGDVLDVSDLLPTLTEAQLKSGGYLKFEYVSGDAATTVVKLSIDADGSAVGGSVYTPLATITMTGAGTIDPTAIMNQLLANQEIKF